MKEFKISIFGRRIGFTLTEILIVVVIVGVLATLALPVLVKTLEKAKIGEATSNLNLIRTGQKIYFLEHGFFSGDIPNLNIENPNEQTNRFFCLYNKCTILELITRHREIRPPVRRLSPPRIFGRFLQSRAFSGVVRNPLQSRTFPAQHRNRADPAFWSTDTNDYLARSP